ncbi:uncharacterized protein LOC130644950 [Hydractinia symbiolongicarpus]|uniref:uncharacterized protein LOC130644950 n=1 Tax=Hydractinia symbiolongicarpus TaxID=13093 RepID=UPI0025500F3F|nr:uncharacterized protein LOC130644950 [Hydractinia symbiolongicarpus]
MMVLSNVKSYLASGNLNDLQKVSSSLRTTLDNKLRDPDFSVLLDEGAVKRNEEAESFIPKDHLKDNSIRALRSVTDGDCLYSSASLAVSGTNDLIDELRALTCIELFENSLFYSNHPIFVSLCQSSDLFSCVESTLKFSVSHSSVDTGLSAADLVQKEAILMCSKNIWSSFICILALTSVLKRNISTLYPDCGQLRFKTLFNQNIFPRLPSNKNLQPVSILFCNNGKHSGQFKPNHFVPLVSIKLSKATLKRPAQYFQARLPYFMKTESKIKRTENVCVSSPNFSSSLGQTTLVNQCGTSGTNEETSSISKKPTFNFKNFFVKGNAKLKPITPEKVFSAKPLLNSFPPGYIDGIGKFDVGTYYKQAPHLSDHDIVTYVDNVTKPDQGFTFPRDKLNRRFRYVWFAQFLWLAYSNHMDAAFCLPCTLLHQKVNLKSALATNLISKGQNYWNDSVSVYKKHEKSALHKDTSSILTSLRTNQSGTTKKINELVSTMYSKKVEANRIFLAAIIDTVILCGRLCISLRGHRDNLKDFPEVGGYAPYSVGNFLDLLNYRVRGGDIALGNHLKACSKNATYLSPQTQNEIISCCGDYITDKIISAVKQAKFFSIICDEACDTSTKEQMSVVLRFVDQHCNLREEFIRFVHCSEGLSGLSLSKVILKTLNELSLDIQNCRGQCYDGAGNVAGKINGCQAHILKQNRLDLYTHCSSHRLNLVVCNSCSVHYVRNMMDQIKQITYFFKFSESRLKLLRKNVADFTNNPNYAHIIDFCNTRWVERIIGMSVFNDLFEGILATFDEMALNPNGVINADFPTL